MALTDGFYTIGNYMIRSVMRVNKLPASTTHTFNRVCLLTFISVLVHVCNHLSKVHF